MQKFLQLSKENIVLDVFSEDCENVSNWFVITNELYVCHRLLSCYKIVVKLKAVHHTIFSLRFLVKSEF